MVAILFTNLNFCLIIIDVQTLFNSIFTPMLWRHGTNPRKVSKIRFGILCRLAQNLSGWSLMVFDAFLNLVGANKSEMEKEFSTFSSAWTPKNKGCDYDNYRNVNKSWNDLLLWSPTGLQCLNTLRWNLLACSRIVVIFYIYICWILIKVFFSLSLESVIYVT